MKDGIALVTYRFGSKTSCFLKTSATMGTVELTGFEITRTNALGAVFAMAVARSWMMPPLIYHEHKDCREDTGFRRRQVHTLKRSSLERRERII